MPKDSVTLEAFGTGASPAIAKANARKSLIFLASTRGFDTRGVRINYARAPISPKHYRFRARAKFKP
jgi:hypothetical protein